VYVKFLITNNGYVSDARIQKSLNPAADKAALDVVNGMNANVGKWTPGTKEGIPVTMDMVLPISFVLGTSSGADSGTGTKPNNTTGAAAAAESSSTNETVYPYVEEMPVFPEGMEAMYKFIYERIQYPALAREKGIAGQVILQFIVSSQGDVHNAKVLRGIGGGCDEEALRVVNEMPRWKPGKKDGQPVAVSFTLPIKFVLQSNDGAIKQSSPDTIQEKQTVPQTPVTALSGPAPNTRNLPNGDLHLAPNPARDHVVVDLFEGAQAIFVFAADGVQIAKVDVSKSSETRHWIDTTKYPEGQYSVQVISSKEKRSGQFAVIK
jgi:TonB family protein